MSAAVGWALAGIAVVLGVAFWGVAGIALAASGIVLWLLLQFTRVSRVLVQAHGPVGRIGSAVELNARLHRGMRLIDILARTGSLGRPVERTGGVADECLAWQDGGGVRVVASLRRGRLVGWRLERPEDLNSPPAFRGHRDGDARP